MLIIIIFFTILVYFCDIDKIILGPKSSSFIIALTKYDIIPWRCFTLFIKQKTIDDDNIIKHFDLITEIDSDINFFLLFYYNYKNMKDVYYHILIEKNNNNKENVCKNKEIIPNTSEDEVLLYIYSYINKEKCFENKIDSYNIFNIDILINQEEFQEVIHNSKQYKKLIAKIYWIKISLKLDYYQDKLKFNAESLK